MKPDIKIGIFILSLMLICLSSKSFSQCDKKKLCKDDMGDFDYSSQSSFAKLSPGDTATIKIVVYSGKNYRIMVCGDPKLGDIKYKIVTPIRKTSKITYTVNKKQVTNKELKPDANGFVYDNSGNKYKLDENGSLIETKVVNKKSTTTVYAKDANGDYSSPDGYTVIPSSTLKFTEVNSVVYDSIPSDTKRYTDEELIYNSQNGKNGKKYWEESIDKTKRIFIKIEVPPGDKTYSGCVGVYVGNMSQSKKNFSKQK